MHRIAIIHDPSSTHALSWTTWLEAADYAVDRIHDDDSLCRSMNATYDLVIPLITIYDYVSKHNARMEALSYFTKKGTKLLTPPEAIAASSDKLKTAEILGNFSLPHPQTFVAEEYDWDVNKQMPVVLKPRFGHSGHEVRLIHDEREFNKCNRRGMLVQQFIDNATCIRVIASQSEILSAYKKTPPPGELIANIGRGAKRHPITLTSAMRELAQSAVRALGGGLMGVDLLDSSEGLYVLEANVPFGFDANDQNLQQRLIAFINNEIQ